MIFGVSLAGTWPRTIEEAQIGTGLARAIDGTFTRNVAAARLTVGIFHTRKGTTFSYEQDTTSAFHLCVSLRECVGLVVVVVTAGILDMDYNLQVIDSCHKVCRETSTGLHRYEKNRPRS